MKFVDEITFTVASGDGGAGHVSFLREKFVTRGGPDGGDGGRGGTLVFEATHARNTLVDFRFNKVYRAGSGQKGAKRNCTGRSGADEVLLVPVGTLIFDEATGELLADLDRPHKRWELPGGRGGKGNAHFATATHRTPRMAQEGEPGTQVRVRLELRLLADVGLLGLPNAGKSTLISRISAARPKVAAYPFTTLVPNLGVVNLGEGRSFVVADVPGLIEGASDGAGLGHQFLRHLQRCSVIVHLVAADDEADPAERVHLLREELRAFDSELADREQWVVLSKVDVLTPEALQQMLDALRQAGIVAHPISAVAGTGLPRLKDRLWGLLQQARREAEAADPDPSGALP
ncbi:MAG: GTPase ObgE [Myxococcales bacterium]|nr:GTPase ObgE [Myxococcales bacterium]